MTVTPRPLLQDNSRIKAGNELTESELNVYELTLAALTRPAPPDKSPGRLSSAGALKSVFRIMRTGVIYLLGVSALRVHPNVKQSIICSSSHLLLLLTAPFAPSFLLLSPHPVQQTLVSVPPTHSLPETIK